MTNRRQHLLHEWPHSYNTRDVSIKSRKQSLQDTSYNTGNVSINTCKQSLLTTSYNTGNVSIPLTLQTITAGHKFDFKWFYRCIEISYTLANWQCLGLGCVWIFATDACDLLIIWMLLMPVICWLYKCYWCLWSADYINATDACDLLIIWMLLMPVICWLYKCYWCLWSADYINATDACDLLII